MWDLMTPEQARWVVPLVVALIIVLGYLLYRRGRGTRLKKVLSEIGHDRIENLLIPNGDEGEIQIDHLILTSQGLLIIDIK